jgi:epoxyqueuosine reductase
MSKLFSSHFNSRSDINELALQLGFSHWNVVGLKQPLSIAFYESWLKRGYHADMSYLEKHLPQKQDPQQIHPDLRSSLVFIHPYYPHPKKDSPETEMRIALYARGEDYHLWLLEKLKKMIAHLQEKHPDQVFLPATDSSPVLERDLAYQAGLGWFGKNTCLIKPKTGSLFFIAEILTSLESDSTPELIPDFCGTCTRCIDACPTGAIEEPRLLNAKKCISYLTIESQEIPALDLREKMQDWFFGCDICQTVCPWNQKVFGKNLETVPKRQVTDNRQALISELREILQLSGKQLQRKFHGSPLLRARPFGLRRNAIIVATNQNLKELSNDILFWQKDAKLKDLVDWSLKKLAD